jgi:DnaJ-class molecular chaperone
MLKKNYYELLGVSPNITKEQIWEEYERLRRKFFAEYPRARVSKKEKKESEDAFMIALGILTDIEERKRYDKHLKQFGSDENFPSDYDFAKGNFDKLASILIRVTEKEKELFETRENEKLKLTSEIRRILRDLISMGDK